MKSKIKVLADSVPGVSSFPDLQMAAFLMCPHVVSLALFTRAIDLLDWGLILMSSLNLYHLLTGSVSKCSNIGG